MSSRSKKGRAGALAMVLGFALGAVACSSDKKDTTTTASQSTTADSTGGGDTTAAPTTTTVATDPNGEFTYACNCGGNTFDPHTTPGFAVGGIFMQQVYDRLLTLTKDKDGAIVVGPELATAWEFSADGLSLKMTLRTGVKFTDGADFNGSVVKANIERAKSEKSTIKSNFTTVDSVEVVDASHVVFKLNTKNPSVTYMLAVNTNSMMVSPAAFDKDLAKAAVGTGPFKLVSNEPNVKIVYEANPSYWDPKAVLLKKVTVLTVLDNTARLNGYKNGDFQGIYTLGLEKEASALVPQGYQFLKNVTPVSIGILFNNKIKPFDDVRVRQAISMALDRNTIATKLLDGFPVPMYQAFPKGTVGYVEALEKDPYNVAKAKQLLTDAGVVGTSITLYFNNAGSYATIAPVVQQALTDLGIKVTLVPNQPTDAYSAWLSGKNGMWIGPIQGEYDPTITVGLSYTGGLNVGNIPPELKTMADAAGQLVPGTPERNTAYQAINKYLTENAVHVPVLQGFTTNTAAKNVVGFDKMMIATLLTLNFRYVGLAKK